MSEIAEKQTNTAYTEEELKMIWGSFYELKKSLKDKETSDTVQRAFELALEAHGKEGQRRKSGEPYILHPIEVAKIIHSKIGLRCASITAALLHDVVEDTDVKLDEISDLFGKEVKHLVNGVTKIKSLNTQHYSSDHIENFKKLLFAMSKDVRVIIIKIADRLHNMQTLSSMKREKQISICQETIHLYAPLAHRLGFHEIKTALEDLSLKFLFPKKYKLIAQQLNEKKAAREKYIATFIEPIKELLDKKGMNLHIYGRPKSIYSIYKKMEAKQVSMDEIYDLFAIRIIIETTDLAEEKALCWRVFSYITEIYKINPSRIRDWITNPKSNGYESLHITVMDKMGKWVEIQIRTKRMHEIAEKGIAAHWKYKENTSGKNLDLWLNRVRTIFEDPVSSKENIEFITQDIVSDEIYVFTPKGKVINLVSNASVLDFAFAVHTEIGLRCTAAKVGDKLVKLSHKLQNGDQIKIFTSNNQKPNEDWLQYVVTSKARTFIKKAINEEKKIIWQEGKEKLERYLKSMNVLSFDSTIQTLLSYYKFSNANNLFVMIGEGKIEKSDIKLILNSQKNNKEKTPYKIPFIPKRRKRKKELEINNNARVVFGDELEKYPYMLANCCNPVFGDEIFGYNSLEAGFKVHRAKCPNAENIYNMYRHRVIPATWMVEQDGFLTTLRIKGIDNVGLINKITNVVTNAFKTNITKMDIGATENIFDCALTMFVKNKEQLNGVMKALKEIEEVKQVYREN